MRKPKENKIYTLWHFVVEGRFEFPFDMLRYDRCWPQFETEVAALNPHLRSRISEKRRIHMVGLREPTGGRWHSFGWEVSEAVPHTVGG